MGFFTNLALEAAWKIEEGRRAVANLDMKMEIFCSGYKDTVIGKVIPISGGHSERKGNSLFPSYYVRTEHKSGSTSFHWFHHPESAKEFANTARKEPNNKKTIGPYAIPYGKDERYM